MRDPLDESGDAPFDKYVEDIVDPRSWIDEPQCFVHQVYQVPEAESHVIVFIAVIIGAQQELPELKGDFLGNNEAIDNDNWEMQNNVIDQEHVK